MVIGFLEWKKYCATYGQNESPINIESAKPLMWKNYDRKKLCNTIIENTDRTGIVALLKFHKCSCFLVKNILFSFEINIYGLIIFIQTITVALRYQVYL